MMMKGSRPSPIKQEETSMREGILTVLRDPDHEQFAKSSPSIRRTLSADMSSKKWLAQNGFFLTPHKEVVDNRHSPSPSCKESNPSQDDVWRSIVRSQKDNQNKVCYVPPSLVKRSLSEKSLEVCTESLGSETGSDCNLSSYGSSEFSSCDDEDYQEPEKTVTTRDPDWSEKLGIVPVKYKSAPVRPFPPPIRSSLNMRSRRESGRLVLEAVSGPSRNRFIAQRGNGRLVLQMSDEITKSDEQVYDGMQEIGHEGDGEKKYEVSKSDIVMKKLVSLGNNYAKKKNSTSWINQAIEDKEGRGGGGDYYYPKIITQSLPPPIPRVSRMIPKPQKTNNSFSFGTYEYFRRRKAARNTMVVSNEAFVAPRVIGNKYTKPMLLLKKNKYYNDDVDDDRIIYGATKEYMHQDFKGCKEAKRTLLMWEPYCIATS